MRSAALALVLIAVCSANAGAQDQSETVESASGATSPALAAQIEQVRCTEIAFSESVESGDWETFRSLIHPEARFPGMDAVGPEVVTQRWRGAFSSETRTIRWRPRSVEILQAGELALSQGPYRVLVQSEEGTSESWGTFNSIWSREHGTWQIIFDLGSEGIKEGDRELLVAETTGCEGPAAR